MSDREDFRARIRHGLAALLTDPGSRAAASVLAPETIWHLSHPGGVLAGPDAVTAGGLEPLRSALSGCHRRDLLFIGGRSTRAAGGDWAACVTHYVGNFRAPLFGLPPSRHVAFLRAGEFYRIDRGRIAEARIIFDLPDLMRQSGCCPLPLDLGTELTFPAPATQDGLIPADRQRGADSLALVECMLSDLRRFDPETFGSRGQTGPAGYWADDMLWYGPCGIGSNHRWEGFVDDHRERFLQAFPDREGGNHYCRIGDGDYAAVSGWPSMTMTHRGPYLGCPPSGQALTLRVMDFYRCQFTGGRGQIAENWVFLDFMDLTRQMGRDLVAEANALWQNR